MNTPHTRSNQSSRFFKSVMQLSLSFAFIGSLASCAIPFIDNESDYKGAGRARPLEVPPDLTASPVSDAYNIPGSTSYSTYAQAQTGQEVGVQKVLATPEGVRLERAGAQRWLVVNAPVDKVWPIIREFWLEQGFAVRVENPQTGVMETEWVDSDKIKKESTLGPLDKFDKWLDKLSGIADKKKFRTRLDRGTEADTSEIYMTHRTVSSAPDDGKNRVQTQLGEIDTGYRADAKSAPKATEIDAELDAELLRRLMVKLGIEEKRSQSILADAQTTKRAEVIKVADGSAKLVLTDAFDRAWRRVGLSLDIIGFVIEDKDRANGLYFVRYADANIDDTPKKQKGLFETLKFWGDDEPAEKTADTAAKKEDKSIVESLKFWGKEDKQKTDATKQYRILVREDESGKTEVTVVDKDNVTVKTTTANRILALMYEQLK